MKIKMTDKERHILYRLLAVVLIAFLITLQLGFSIYLSSIVYDYYYAWWYLLSPVPVFLIAIPVWRYYR